VELARYEYEDEDGDVRWGCAGWVEKEVEVKVEM